MRQRDIRLYQAIGQLGLNGEYDDSVDMFIETLVSTRVAFLHGRGLLFVAKVWDGKGYLD